MSCMPTSLCDFSAAHVFLSDVFATPLNHVSLLSDGLQGQPQWQLQLQRDVEVETVTQQPKTKKGAPNKTHCSRPTVTNCKFIKSKLNTKWINIVIPVSTGRKPKRQRTGSPIPDINIKKSKDGRGI